MINYDYICKECGVYSTIKHSIKENPDVRCPECGEKMQRDISGGEEPIIKGGNLPGKVTREVQKREREEMQHAHEVKDWVKKKAQPMAREGLKKALVEKKVREKPKD